MSLLFIDSDIILDLLTRRNDYSDAVQLFHYIAGQNADGYTTPLVLANVHYIMTKYAGKKKSLENIRKIRSFLGILTMDEKTVDDALISDPVDFEDCLQYKASELACIDFIITRNKADYKGSFLPVLTAGEYLAI